MLPATPAFKDSTCACADCDQLIRLRQQVRGGPSLRPDENCRRTGEVRLIERRALVHEVAIKRTLCARNFGR